MNKRQQIVQGRFLDNEEAVNKRLFQVYSKSFEDVSEKSKKLYEEFEQLKAEYDLVEDEAEREVLKSRMQSKVYQKQYQDGLKKEIGGILDKMKAEQFTTVSDYLNKCYEEAFVGTMYDLQGQGIPLCFPLDQEAMVRAVQTDSKISKGLYNHLGEDVEMLKKHITAQVSRGISSGMTFGQIAQQLSLKMVGTYENPKGSYAYAKRIARTEGHRIQVQSTMDTCYKAKEKGADVVKQWDATLDDSTRESHQQVDGEIKELDEKFSNGLMFPGDPSGGAAEVVNCRCALSQRARWALGDDFTKWDGRKGELVSIKASDYDDFKKQYWAKAEKQSLTNNDNDDRIPLKISDGCKKLVEQLDKNGVEYRAVQMHSTPLSNDEIIKALSGGDNTKGSCASVGLAYIGQKGNMNVLDFRDGASRNFFATKYNLKEISKFPGVKTIVETAKSAVTAGKKCLKQVEIGKEYYLVSGRHAAIVRKTDEGILQYLELQSATRSGWTDFNGNPGYTLKSRFGDVKNSFGVDAFMIDVDSLKESSDLKKLLGYINTSEDKQRKGVYGTIK